MFKYADNIAQYLKYASEVWYLLYKITLTLLSEGQNILTYTHHYEYGKINIVIRLRKERTFVEHIKIGH